MRAEWNSALFACVVAAYAALLLALPRHVGLPSEPQHLPAPRLPAPASRPLALATAHAEAQAEGQAEAEAEKQAEAGAEAEAEAEAGGQGAAPPSMYAWWPTSAPLAHEEPGRLPLTLPLPLPLALALLLPLP